MNNFEQKNNFSWIDEKINKAIKNPISEKEFNVLFEEQFKESGYTKEDYENFKEKTKACRIDTNYLHEYKYALQKLGYSEDAIKSFLAHENAHGNVATSVGADHQGYSLYIFSDNGVLKLKQGALVKYPEHWNEEERILATEKIATAPETYEKQKLSDADKKMAKK